MIVFFPDWLCLDCLRSVLTRRIWLPLLYSVILLLLLSEEVSLTRQAPLVVFRSYIQVLLFVPFEFFDCLLMFNILFEFWVFVANCWDCTFLSGTSFHAVLAREAIVAFFIYQVYLISRQFRVAIMYQAFPFGTFEWIFVLIIGTSYVCTDWSWRWWWRWWTRGHIGNFEFGLRFD